MLPTAASVDHQPAQPPASYVDVPETKPLTAICAVVVALVVACGGGIYGALALAVPAFVLCWFALHWLARWNGVIAIPAASLLTITAAGYGWMQNAGHIPSLLP